MRIRATVFCALLASLPIAARAGPLARSVVVLPDRTVPREALDALRRTGTRVRAVVPPRLVLVEGPVLARLPGMRVLAGPDGLDGAGLPPDLARTALRLLVGARPVMAPMARAHERPPSPPLPVTFDGWPRNNLVEYLQGTIVVAVLIAESTGLHEPKTESWSAERVEDMKARIEEGVLRFLDYDPTGDVTFVFHYPAIDWGGPPGTVPCDWEPINHASWPSGNETVPWCSVLSHLGYPDCPGGPRWDIWLGDVRDQYGADWAFVVRVVDEENQRAAGGPASPAHAEILGPGTTLYSTNGSEVITHELGHVFGALDEYCNGTFICPPPTFMSGYLGVVDANATGPGQGGIDDGWGEQAPSLMSFNDVEHVNPYTMQAWGVSDSEGDGVQDVHRTWPRTSIGEVQIGEDGGISVHGRSRVTVLPTTYGKPPGTSIKRIADVRWRVDGNAWQRATPSDGAFDDGTESWTLATPPLPSGLHLVEVQAADDRGFVERVPAARRLFVQAGASPSRMPVFATLEARPRLASPGMQVTLDATWSTDGEGQPLSFRFDTDGDGAWDGPPTTAGMVGVPAGSAGEHEARVEVLAPGAPPAVAVVRWTVAVSDLPPRAVVRLPGGDRVFGTTEPVIRFDASGSTDPEGSVLDFRWQVHGLDESLDTGYGAGPAFDYPVTMPAKIAWHTLHYPTKTWIRDLEMPAPDLAVTCEEDFGVHVVDLSDPAVPALLGSLEVPGGWDGAFGLLALAPMPGTRLLACGETATFVLDMSAPASPLVAGATAEAAGGVCETHGSVGYVGGADGLKVLDLSEPATPLVTGMVSTAKVGMFLPVGAHALFQAGDATVRVLDLADPLAPQEVGTLDDLEGRAIFLAPHRGYARDWEGGVMVFDPSALPELHVLGEFQLAPQDGIVWAADDALYVARMERLAILDVADLTVPPRTVFLGGPFFGNALLRPIADGRILEAVMGFVATADPAEASWRTSAGIRADAHVRDAAGNESSASAYAWVNPYDHSPSLEVTTEPASAQVPLGGEVRFALTASDPDLAQPWDGWLAWRADLDGDGNWESDWQLLDPLAPSASTKWTYDRVGATDAVVEVRDRFRATARSVVRVQVSPTATPHVLALDPASSAPGVHEDVVLLGTGLDVPVAWVDLGDGVAVAGVLDQGPLSARLRIQVSPVAGLGPRDVAVGFTDGSEARLPGGLAIVPCVVAVDPPGWQVVPSSTLHRLRPTGGATPVLEQGKPMDSWGVVLDSSGVYAAGQHPGRDELWARSRTCCNDSGQPYEDCRATRVVVDVVAPEERPVLRLFGGANGVVLPPGASADVPVEASWVAPPVSGVWVNLVTAEGPLDARLRSPAGTEIELFSGLASVQGWAPIDWSPSGDLAAFDGQTPGGAWTLRLSNPNPVQQARLEYWQLALRAPEGGSTYDWQPPAAVKDLAVAWDEATWAAVATWTAPADLPGGGPVTTRSLRISRNPIPPWMWDGALEVVGLPPPAAPGTPETVVLAGLEPGAWWAAVRSTDANGSASGLSNAAAFEVPAGLPSEPSPEVGADQGAEPAPEPGPEAVVEPVPEGGPVGPPDAAFDPGADVSPGLDGSSPEPAVPEQAPGTAGGGCGAGPAGPWSAWLTGLAWLVLRRGRTRVAG